ncbi:MAG: hypothetical protein HON54_08420 [Verrucomicrobia bacterium]|nr:hypothetical protein [Verrucomicrobiota bacterium]
MAAPAKLPEFKGNVTAVLTKNYWNHHHSKLSSWMGKVNAGRRSLGNDKTLSAEERRKLAETYKEEIRILETGISNTAYHYMGSSKVLSQIGKAFADALTEMQ